jgi:hypothetical protein
VTPETRAARDRIAAYLAARAKYTAEARARDANPEYIPGDAIDNQADTAEVLPVPGPGGWAGGPAFPRPGSASFPLRDSDLHLVLAALDRLDAENRLHDALRDRPPGKCNQVRPHDAHRWLPTRSALDCPGIPAPCDHGSGQ